MSEPVPDWTAGEPVLFVTVCSLCGTTWYLPAEHCPVCGSGDHDVRAARGTGLCVAVTRVHVRADADDGVLCLGLLELDEGPVVMGRVHDPDLAAGDRARIEFRTDGPDGGLLPSFARQD
ncbi:MAG TPA: zinc ribbon domain-containing protein [Nocardioides sp.]|uniref:Zn-ribbon domain-containing OB-fold protein n=1 Tax=uncultured Nocardioides sp. TaxID=198441 RepID=UPI00260B92A3|nr:OB-fold domain-containing protein [uncultured Nocardioides sp.]HRD59784.1 zinc ribbon domain-containing protein [Nocardioides sp.]HRI98599.1 zinc ribbon domain-containing protein [Nocardioides sp.]